jgi:probable rRNA maturation factor
MTRLNKEFRGIDGTTDVLAFDAGDIVISLDRAKAQAFEYGHSLERELCFLVVHGALHLLGYGHDCPESESVMTAKQKEILKGLGLER